MDGRDLRSVKAGVGFADRRTTNEQEQDPRDRPADDRRLGRSFGGGFERQLEICGKCRYETEKKTKLTRRQSRARDPPSGRVPPCGYSHGDP